MPDDGKGAADKGPAGEKGADKGSEAGAVSADQVSTLMDERFKGFEDRLKSSMGGVAKKQMESVLKSEGFTSTLGDAVSAAVRSANAPKPPDPTEVQVLKTQVDTLAGDLQKQGKRADEAEMSARDQQLKLGISAALDALDGKENRPPLKADARASLGVLLGTGFGLNAAPALGDNGAVVVAQLDGTVKPLLDILVNGYFTKDDYRLEKFTAAGSGAGGAIPKPGEGGGKPLTQADLYDKQGKNVGIAAMGNADQAYAEALRLRDEAVRRLRGAPKE